MPPREQKAAIELRKQFQDASFATAESLWKGVRVVLTLIFALFSVQSGLILWASTRSLNNPVLVVIPITIGISILSVIGLLNARRDYRNLLEYTACLAKIEDEIDFLRKNKISFESDDSILSDRWLEARKKYKTTKEFVNELLKIRFTAYGIIVIIYYFIIIIAFCMLFLIYFLPFQK